MTAFSMGPALLFCPADRPERYAKAAERADAVILDLEDAVSPEAKAAAREHLIDQPLDPARTIVRVNPAGTAEHTSDMEALARTDYRTVILAKTQDAQDTIALADYDVIALIESAAGVVQVREIAAAPSVVALMWGAEDLMASLGGTSSRRADGQYRDVARHTRSATLLAAGAFGKGAIDAVHVVIDDVAGLADEASDAVASGFAATACIHPSQVEVIRTAYLPSAQDVAWARGVLEAAVGQHGAFRWNGQLIDGPFLIHAEEVLRRAQ